MSHNILITGASSDIGRAITELLLDSDCSLVLQTRDASGLAEVQSQYPGRVCVIASELSSAEQLDKLWCRTIDAFGHIDGIVHNASFATALPASLGVSWWEAWEASMTVNVIAPAYLNHLASDHFVQRNTCGKVITLTSRASHQGDRPEKMHYAAAKAALANVTKTLARHFQHYAIYAYNIAPSFVQTARIEETVLPYQADDWINTDLPLKALVPPEEIASLVRFLLTQEAHHLTGATLDVNGATYVR